MNCDRLIQVHQYHDGELPAGERDAFDAHLKSCTECQDLLTDLRGMSRMLIAAPMVGIADDAMQRLRDARYVLPDTGVLKIAGWLTAAAAAVLIAVLPLWHQEQHEQRIAVVPAADPNIDVVAMTTSTDADANHNDLVALAQWMSDDLAGNERH